MQTEAGGTSERRQTLTDKVDLGGVDLLDGRGDADGGGALASRTPNAVEDADWLQVGGGSGGRGRDGTRGRGLASWAITDGYAVGSRGCHFVGGGAGGRGRLCDHAGFGGWDWLAQFSVQFHHLPTG